MRKIESMRECHCVLFLCIRFGLNVLCWCDGPRNVCKSYLARLRTKLHMFIVWIVEPQRSAAHCIQKNAGNFNVTPMCIFSITLPLKISLSSNTANEYINQIRNWWMQCNANKYPNNRIDWACCTSFYGIIIWCTKYVLMRNIACIVVQYRQTHCPMAVFPNSMSSKVCVCPAPFGVNGHYINYNGVFTFCMHTLTHARIQQTNFYVFSSPVNDAIASN